MTLFVLDLMALAAVMLGAVVLVILREKNGTRIVLVAIFFEAMCSLVAKLMVAPDAFTTAYFAFKDAGRLGEALAMWGVIVLQVKGLLDIAQEDKLQKVERRLDELMKHAAIKGEDDASTH